MNAKDFVDRLTDYYSGKYGRERMSQLAQYSENIPDEDREAVYRKIIEDRLVSTAIAVSDIAKACADLGVPCRNHRAEAHAGAYHVECGCCGLGYTYKMAVSDWERIEENVHATCPRCGFSHADEIRYRAYLGMGIPADADYHKTYAADHDRRRKEHVGTDKAPAWSRAKAIAERDEAKKDAMARILGDAMHSVKKTPPAQVPVSQLKSVRPKPEPAATVPFDDDLVY